MSNFRSAIDASRYKVEIYLWVKIKFIFFNSVIIQMQAHYADWKFRIQFISLFFNLEIFTLDFNKTKVSYFKNEKICKKIM